MRRGYNRRTDWLQPFKQSPSGRPDDTYVIPHGVTCRSVAIAEYISSGCLRKGSSGKGTDDASGMDALSVYASYVLILPVSLKYISYVSLLYANTI